MIGKIIALIATVAVVVSADCGSLTTGVSGIYGSRVLNAGCSVPVASAFPSCSPVAVPTAVVDPIPTTSVAGAVAPVSGVIFSGSYGSGVYGAGVCGAGVYGSGLYRSGFYGSGLYGSTLGGCSCGAVSTVY